PAAGGLCRFTPSYRRASSSGGRENRKSRGWVRAGRVSSEAGAARQRAACRPAPPSPALDAAVSCGRSLSQARGPRGAGGWGPHWPHPLARHLEPGRPPCPFTNGPARGQSKGRAVPPPGRPGKILKAPQGRGEGFGRKAGKGGEAVSQATGQFHGALQGVDAV